MAGAQDPGSTGPVGDDPVEQAFFGEGEAPGAAPEATAAPAPEAPAEPDGPTEAEAEGPAGHLPLGDEPWEAVAQGYEREARAYGTDPAAARLWHEAGLVYEEQLGRPRQAAVCYQTAFRIAPTYRPNIHSARRLFAGVGNWSMVAQLLHSEAEATEDPERKAALLFERAVLLHDRLGKQAEASALLEEVLALRPADLTALAYVEGLAIRSGDLARLADLYRRQAEQVPSKPVRLALLCGAAGLYADRLGDAAQAAALYEEAHRLDPVHPVPLEALERLYAVSGNAEGLLAVLEAAARATAHPAEAAAALHRAAQVAREALGRSEDALRLLETARELAPEDTTVLYELAAAYEAGERHEQRVDVLTALTKVVRDRRALAELERQLGALLDEPLQRSDEAAAAYRRMLEVSPGNADALAALGKLYFRVGRWEDLIWTFQQEIEATRDPKQRAMRLFKIAEIQESRLEKIDDAVATLRRVLDVAPGYLPALQALTRLYETEGRWEDLVALHESELEAVGEDREQSLFLLEKIARLLEERLGDRDGSIGAYERILALVPDHLPTIRRLQRLYEETARWTDVIRLIEREAEVVGDQRQVIALLHRTCEILEDPVGDKDAAIEAYRRVLALQPNYLPALKALGKLYHQKGKWTELVEMYRMELEVTESPEHTVALLLKMGELFETHLLDEEEAIRTYREILDTRPDVLRALRALGRLHARRGEWDRVVDVLRREAEVVEDASERAQLLCRAAEVRETRSSRPDQAVQLYLEALGHRPDHVLALRALARIYGAAGAWRELASVYERALAASSPADRVRAYQSLAHLYLDRLDDAGRAIQCLEAVLADRPDDPVALEALGRLYAAGGAHGKAAALRETLAGQAEQPEVAAALLHNAALTHELLEEPPRTATETWQRVLSLVPDDDVAARRIEVEARRARDFGSLLELYRARRERAEGDDVRLSLSMRIAELALQGGDTGLAETSYRDALELAPDHLPAIRGLKSLLAARGAWDEVQGLLEREGETSRDPERAVGLLFEAGVLREEHLKDGAAAEANYRKVLERDPVEPRAYARLAALLEAGGRWAELAALHAERAERLKDPAERADAHLRAADVHEQRLDDPAAALAAVEQALSARPGEAPTLERAGDLAFALERWQQAAAHYADRVDAGGASAALGHARLRLAVLYQEHLSDPQRAAAFLQDVLAVEPGHREALRRLADLQKAAGNWAGAVTTLTRLAGALEAAGERIEVLLELAALHADQRRDPPAAIRALEEVRALDPKERRAVERLGSLYEAAESWEQVLEVYQQFIELLPEGEKERAAPLWVRVAEIQTRIFSDLPKAIQAWRAAIALAPDQIPYRVALAELYQRDTAWHPQAIEEHREILARAPLRRESLHVLFRLFEQGKAFDKAFCVASVLHFLGATDQEEAFFFTENKGHAPQDSPETLSDAEHDGVLCHPDARGPVAEVLRIAGDQLGKVYPQDVERYGLGRGDRLTAKDGSPLRRLADGLLTNLGGGSFDLYRCEKPAVLDVQPGDPSAVVVSSDVVRRHPVREQRFLLARLVEQVHAGTGLALRLDADTLARTLQGVCEAALPSPPSLAPSDPDLAKRCAKSMSRKARKALEAGPAARLAEAGLPDLQRFADGVRRTTDRAGLLLSGDVEAGLKLVAAEVGFKGAEAPAETTGAPALDALVRFAVSEDFFRLRQRLKLAIA